MNQPETPDIFDMIRSLAIPQNSYRVKRIVDHLEIMFESIYIHYTRQEQRIQELETQLTKLQSRIDEDEKRLAKFISE